MDRSDRTDTMPAEERPVAREKVSRSDKAPGDVVAQRIVYFIGGTIIAFLTLRFILQLLAANQGSWFVDFVYGVSGFFVAPFWGIFGEPTYGAAQFETSTLVAIIVYALLTAGLARLFTIRSQHPEATR